MSSAIILEGLLKSLLILVVVSAGVLVSRRDILSTFRSYAFQSFFLACIAIVLYIQEKNIVLLYTAILTFLSKVWFIPFFLRVVQQKLKIRRDIEFRYLKPTGSLFLSLVIILVVYLVFSPILHNLPVTDMFLLGSGLGISVVLIGMITCFSRKKIIMKVVGYLTMENGAVLFSLFLSELPFMIEIFVVMDLIMMVMITVIMSFGMNTSIEEFHEYLNPFQHWSKGGMK